LPDCAADGSEQEKEDGEGKLSRNRPTIAHSGTSRERTSGTRRLV